MERCSKHRQIVALEANIRAAYEEFFEAESIEDMVRFCRAYPADALAKVKLLYASVNPIGYDDRIFEVLVGCFSYPDYPVLIEELQFYIDMGCFFDFARYQHPIVLYLMERYEKVGDDFDAICDAKFLIGYNDLIETLNIKSLNCEFPQEVEVMLALGVQRGKLLTAEERDEIYKACHLFNIYQYRYWEQGGDSIITNRDEAEQCYRAFKKWQYFLEPLMLSKVECKTNDHTSDSTRYLLYEFILVAQSFWLDFKSDLTGEILEDTLLFISKNPSLVESVDIGSISNVETARRDIWDNAKNYFYFCYFWLGQFYMKKQEWEKAKINLKAFEKHCARYYFNLGLSSDYLASRFPIPDSYKTYLMLAEIYEHEADMESSLFYRELAAELKEAKG